MSIELHMNPYTPSQHAAEELLLSNDCPERGLLRRTRWPRGVLAVLALVYFLSCLIVWSRYWYTGYFVPGTLRDYAMFGVAATLVVSSTGTLYGLFRNRRRISTVFTLVMFIGLSAFALCCAL